MTVSIMIYLSKYQANAAPEPAKTEESSFRSLERNCGQSAKHKPLDKFMLPVKAMVLVMILLFSAYVAQAAPRTASITGNWNATATWGGAAVPTAADAVTINSGITVTVTAPATCLSVTNNGILTTTTFGITVAGPWVNNGTFNAGTGTVTFNGATAAINSGTGTANFNIIAPALTATTLAINTATTCSALTFGNATAANTVNINANTTCGTLTFYAVTAAAGVGTVNISSGITLNVTGAITIPRAGTLINTLAVGAGILNAGSIAFTAGATTVRHRITISTGTVTVTGNVTGVGGVSPTIAFTGAGFLKLGGALFTSALGTLTTIAGSTVEYNGSIAQTVQTFSYANLTISGSNTKTLAAATPIVNGALTVKAGSTLALSTYALGATTAPTSVVMEIGTTGSTISGTGTMDLGGNVAVNYITGTNGATISCPIALDGTRTFTVADDGSSATDLTISGVMSLGTGTGWGIVKAGTGTLLLSRLNTYTGATSINTGTLDLGVSSAATASGPLGTGAGGTTVASGAVLDLNGFSLTGTYTETLSLSGTGIGGLGALTNSSSTASTYIGVITFTADASIVGEGGTIAITGIPATGTTAITLGGSAGGSVSTVIAGARTLTKAGTGTWTLSGVNTYSGATAISAGTLKLGSTTALGTSSATTVTSGAVLDLSGFTLTTARPLTLNGTGLTALPAGALTNTGGIASYSGAITLGSASTITATSSGTLTCSGTVGTGAFALTLDGAAGTGTMSGIISTPTSVIKNGAGTWTFSGLNTYTGTTTINTGTLVLNSVTSYASSTTTVNSPGILELTSTNTAVDNWRLNTILAGNGTINKTGIGWIQTFTNANTFSGTFNVQAGTFGTSYLNSDWTGITADFNVSAGALLDARGQAITLGSLSGAGNVGTTWSTAASVTTGAGNKSGTFSGIINGDGSSVTNNTANPNGSVLSLVKIGTGTQTLSGANIYSGLTTISAGTLKIGASTSALGTIAGITSVTSGAVLDLNGFNLSTAEPLTLNGTGISSGGALINSSATAVTYNGAITLGSASNIGTTGNITLGSAGISGGQDLTKVGSAILSLGSGTATLGGLTISAGTLTSTTGTMNVAGNFTNSSTFTHNSGTVTFNGTGAQSINSGGSSFNNFIITNTGGTCSASTNGITVAGTFTTNASTTLDMVTNALSVNTVAHSGTLRTQNTSATPITASKIWGGTVIFNASTAQTIPASNFNNLTLSNSAGASLGGAVNIGGTLTLTSGIVTTGANLLAVTNTSGSAVTGYSATSYVNGPLQWSLLTGNSYLFPVGDATNYRPFELNSIVCSSPVVRVTMSSAGASTVDGTTLSSVAARNWHAQLISGTFTSATVRITETGLVSTNAVASSSAQVGPYTNQGGNTIGSTISSNAGISYTGSSYFAIGTTSPAVVLSDNGTQVAAAGVAGGTSNVVLHKSALAVTLVNATLTGMTATTAGTYVSADISNLKVWYQTTSTFTGSGTLLSTLTTPGTAGAKTFPSFTSQIITSGTNGYIFITADVAAGATVGNTINLNALTTGNFTFTSASKTGSTTVGGAQTFVAGTATKLVYTVVPTTGTAGTAFSVTVQSQDVNGNPSNPTSNTTITLSKATGSGTLSGTLTGTILTSGNSVTIATPVYSKADVMTLTATATAGMTALTPITSGNITFSAGAAAKLAFTTQPSGGTGGTAWATQPVVTIQDANGNTVTTDNSTVTVAIGTNAGPDGVLSGTLTKTAVSGVADFSTNALKIDKSGTGYTLIATDGSLTSATSSAFDITMGPPTTISATPGTINFGEAGTVSLEASGGGGSGATLTWYAGGCGSGTSIGTDSPLVISNPASTTTYYARWEYGGVYSTCLSTTVTVVKTFYSYQSGDWNSANSWTTDPSGSFWVNSGIPAAADNVVILNGRTITINQSGKSIIAMEIRLGGTLDLLTTNAHNFGTVTGEGVLKIASGNFPGGVYTGFVAPTGGTVEYYNLNNQSISNTQLTYNKLVVSNYTASAYTTLLDNASNNITYTVNGTFDLKNFGAGSLTFYYGNSTPSDNLISMTVKGNFAVASGCNIRVNNFATVHTIASSDVNTTTINPVHSLMLYGDFTNNGSVRFTGLPSPFSTDYYLLSTTAYPLGGTNYGDVQLFFMGATNNTVTCNGTTDFFRFIVDKGSDQTYTLEVNSSSTANFALYGPNNQGNNNFAGYGYYYKALFLNNGTLKLNSNIDIPSISEAGQDFVLLPTACLWVNGANVSTTVTGLNGTAYQAATFYGKLRISTGQFSTGDAAGIVLGDLGVPEIDIEGTGTLDVSQVWNNTGSTNLISYNQTGGTSNFRLTGENHAGAMFSLDNPNTVFNMSGGTINFANNTFVDASYRYQVFNIQVQPGNYTITGGTVNVNLPSSATVYTANSSVPFYNMNITNRTGSGTMTVQMTAIAPNLAILNDLSIGNGALLDMNTNTIGLNVGRNFNLAAGATYTPGTNTTTFNGSGVQTFTNTGTITSGLNNFTLSNASNTSITSDLTVRGTITIGSGCSLNDQGFTINAEGNISNSGTHNSQANGSILLNGSSAQTLGGSGSGVFGNLGVNKTSGTATLTIGQSISGNLRLVNGILTIGSYNLKLSVTSSIYDALTGTAAPTTFGDSKMIKTTGDASDDGVTKSFNATGSFFYPVGTTTYHPASISFSDAPTTWGDVTVKPVAVVHPSADPLYEALKYYWKVTSNSITGILPGSVSHIYYYKVADVTTTDNQYITGVYNPFTWTKGATEQVDIINKKIHFPAVQILDGEYTAGLPNAFGVVKVYYSRANGDWSTASTWSNVSHASGVALTAPGPNDLVVIGDGGSYNHVVTMSANTQVVSGLQLSVGSTLDLNTTTGHNFGTVTGSGAGAGTLRISSSVTPAVFPSGDFGNFLGSNGGTVEYYTETAPGNIGVAFTMPTTYLTGSNTINIANYNNLIISPATGKNITLPNTDLLIYKDLKVSVSGTSVTGIAQLNNQSTTRTITINGNLNVNNGNLQFTNGNSTSQNVTVIGDVTVASGATFDVAANLTATNTLSIQGNLSNNGIFDMIAGATQVCNVTFTGVVSKQINGTTATRSDFNILTVNKGVDRTSMLEVTVNALTLNTSLASAITLTNGTFRLSNSNLAITLSTTSPFTIPGTGCLSANIGTINIGAANNNAADLLLQGRLEVMSSGIVNIGNGGGSSNDIEYASSGNPEINISGGSLNVDGQIRRNISNNAGSLIYNQTGGTVTVKGNSFDSTRGMFELLNAGSQFNVSGGNLIIVNAGIVALADFYLEPGSSTVNGSNGGHTLTLGNSSTPASPFFNLNTTAPLWNLTVDGSTNNKTVNLSINSLSILNNLTINANGTAGTGSVFKANELNVTIGGSMINNNLSSGTGVAAGGYQAGTTGSTQNTTFTGTGTITGTGSNLTNFANLVIGSLSTTPSITLSTNSNLRVNNNLTLTSGTIADAGNTITVLGNIINSAIHSSPLAPGGGILLANNVKQVITTTGNGKLGNVTVNNASGADVIGDSWITGQLTLTSGLLYINDYKLTMDVNASFGGTFDVNHMVALNGAVSDKGVMKYFTGTTSSFVFPIGSSGKYRPVTYSFTSSNAGSIIVIPVNTAHPSVFAPTSDQLNYYWKTTISGFSGVSAITQVYQYGAIEVTGNESAYIGARFSGSLWVQYLAGSINATSHTITVNDLVTGDFTAGEIANFGTVHKLYSLASGNWNSTSIWAEDSPTNPACGYYPNGNPVFIQPGHTITMNINSASAASVDIQGIFDLKQTSFHSLGDITDTLHTGAGKLMIEASVDGMYLFAGANYDRFMASTGTTVELYGSIDAQMPLKPGNISKPYQNLILKGTGIKYMSAETLKILGNLTINIGAKLSDILFNKELYILGNWTDLNTSPATGGFVPGTGLVSVEGSSAQTLTVTNAGITETFYDFRMNNPAGVTIAGGGNAQISNNLTLTSGTITTNTTNSLTLTNSGTSIVTGGSVASYINGPLRKQINNGSFFNFPVGKPSPSPRYGQVYLSGVVTSGIWEAEYFNGSPNSNSPSLTITSMLTPVVSVSNNEYWRIKGVSSGSAYAKLRWDAGSGLSADPVDRDKTRVVEWNPSGTRWENRGNVVTDNGQNSGFVETDNAISMAPGTDLHYLTIGSGSLPLPTATITSPLTAAICNNGVASTTVTVALTGTAPWSLTYKLGDVSTTITNIVSSPVSIVLTSTSPGITQPITSATDFNFNITNVNDFNGVAGISDYTTTVVLTVNQIPDNTITGRTLVGTGEIVAYTTPIDATTYAWTLSSNGTPLTGSSSTYTITWGGGSPGPYTIGLTKTTAAGCQVTNSISVTTSTTPSPVITGKQKVCAGSVEAYSTPSVSGHSYAWTVSANGTITSGAGTNSITITWGSVSINNIVTVRESVTATPAIYTDATRTVDIGIQPSATTPSFVVSSPVCVGNAPSFTINNSELYVRYQLRDNSNNSNSGLFVDGTGGTIVLTGSPIVANTTFNIYAYTLAPFDCGVQLSNPTLTATVVVTPLPIATFSYTASPYCSNAANPSPTFSGGGVAGTFSSTAGLVFVSTATGQINLTLSTAGTYTVTNTIAAAGGCSEVIATSSITITALPVATFSYTGTPYCSNSANPSPTFSGGGVAGTFSSTAGLVFVSTATGQINIAASTAGTYTVTNTIAAAGGCGIVTATTPFSINLNGSWTGSINTDWNTLGNWACNQLPDLTTDVIIATGKSNYPALFSGTDPGKCRNLTIQSSASVTVSGETLQIAGTITNSGTFTATAGTIEMKESGAQVIGTDVFFGNTIMNLTINNSAGVTLQGPLSVTGIVSTTAGILSSGENLTLVSTASQTALIDGTGTGSVSGNVTMQRYLSSALGYKYISSPFNNTTVNAFATYIDLGATFPTFYRYDENKVTAGWVSYTSTSGSLSPMVGYAANFGPTANNVNISITGVVNNGPMSITLSNNGKPYTQGFNLVGNPYPSPIDWAAGGWTKTNIGDAIHFYNATDQYTGTYTHVVNGFGGSPIIPSMQGFFVSVTDPGSATLGFDNSVRVSDNSSGFSKSAAYSETRPYIRLTAGYADEKNPADPVIIYFDEKASVEFDSKLDALKLMNTDVKVPNFYALSADAKLISIGAIPYPDSMSVVPLGLKTEQAGWISFMATSIENMPSGLQIYFLDNKTGIYTDLLQSTGFKLNMIAGTVENRFRLIFSNRKLSDTQGINDAFVAYSSGGKLIVSFTGSEGEKGDIVINNMIGQELWRKQIIGTGIQEFDPQVKTGVYLVSFYSGKAIYSKKVLITNQ